MIRPRNERREAEEISLNENGPVVVFTQYDNRNVSLLIINQKAVAIRMYDFDAIPVDSIVSVRIADKCTNLNAVFAYLPNGEKCFLSLDDYNPLCNTTRHDGKICESDIVIAKVKSLKGRGKNVRITTKGVTDEPDFEEIYDKISHSAKLTVYRFGNPVFLFDGLLSPLDKALALTDDVKAFDHLSDNYSACFSDIKFYKDEDVSLKVLFKVGSAVSLATDRQVNLKSGGRLCIDKTEALYVVDVDSGKNIKTSCDKLAMLTNLEALEEIAKLLILRNLSGIILIDLINVQNDNQRKELMDFMRLKTKNDPLKPVVKDITGLGLMEITRKKTGSSFSEEFIRRN